MCEHTASRPYLHSCAKVDKWKEIFDTNIQVLWTMAKPVYNPTCELCQMLCQKTMVPYVCEGHMELFKWPQGKTKKGPLNTTPL